MLNNLVNFFSVIKAKMIKTSLESEDLIAVGTRDYKYGGGYKPTAIKFEDLQKSLGSSSSNPTFITKRTDTAVDATAGVVMSTVEIPANTVDTTINQTLHLVTRVVKENISASFLMRVYTNTVPDLSGATLLASGGGSALIRTGLISRIFNFWDFSPGFPEFYVIEGHDAAQALSNDLITSPLATTPNFFNPTVTNYIMVEVAGPAQFDSCFLQVIINKES